MKFLVLLSCLCAASGQAGEPAAKSDPRTELPSAIRHARQLLEKEKYALFLKQFAIPADWKRAVESHGREELASAFAKEKAKPLLAALQQIDQSEPDLSEDGMLATYAVKVKNFPHQSIVFQQIEGLWYLRN
ncbi:MAG: hypothetical protein GTO53_12410 [Planctomycetales bacterium]|nr:hypothetical protein [Planctomycetales bacterium]NIM09906.1 hypothetical protein [Planctomycetales bacterium]NIN09345.1 hypothetical protein [Planctomycetales bacterium]NIN78455.1 hypothetical protein [Planctomycetales bacterium]NIO35645.1 hypothetical protein [Planctomycetales bacterium]